MAIGGIFLLVGLIIASVGAYFFRSTQDLLKNGLRSTGKVVELRKTRSYKPVVEFETADNRTIIAVCKVGSTPPRYKVGDSVTVLYRAASPQDISLDEPFQLWFLSWLLGGLGSLFLIVGGAAVIFLKG